MTLYGYSIYSMYAVYHNGKFSHNVQSTKTIIAEDSAKALAQVDLHKGKETKVDENVTITTSDEWIESIYCLGRAIPRTEYDFDEKDKHM